MINKQISVKELYKKILQSIIEIQLYKLHLVAQKPIKESLLILNNIENLKNLIIYQSQNNENISEEVLYNEDSSFLDK